MPPILVFLDRLQAGFTGFTYLARPWEVSLIEAAETSLRQAGRGGFADQVASLGRFQRTNEDRMVLVRDRSGRRLAGYGGEEECLYAARLKGPNGASVEGRVVAFSGGVHSLEFRPSPRSLGSGEITVKAIRSRKAALSLADEIDREEHDS